MPTLSPGAAAILGLAVISGAAMTLRHGDEWKGRNLWVFASTHAEMYQPVIEEWNTQHLPEQGMRTRILSLPALERRLLSGFLANTPVPDLCEAEVAMSAKFFAGPLDAVGVVDLTDRLKAEGLLDRINPASFAPWTSRGRIFGLPHDVHPVLLAYRSDVVEAAGIDVSQIETWDDFIRVLSPLQQDRDGDGYSDSYLLNVWETNSQALEILIYQAGGALIDQDLAAALDSETNARVVATVASWTAGPKRIAANAPALNAEGNEMLLSGKVLCNLLPDWMAGVWMKDLPGLSGKVKLMPLPAWTPGGRRTSVHGGTMLCFPKASPDFETNWNFAKKLYMSRELAEGLFRRGAIISPIRDHWSAPYYSEPNAFFSGQRLGKLYVTAAPDVPLRSSSPYRPLALGMVTDATIRLKRFAEQTRTFDADALLPQARKELAVAQAELVGKMQRNRFQEPAKQ